MKRLIVILTLGYAHCLCAQVYKGGGGPLAFLSVPSTPREVAMGSAGVASSLGVFAPYWNPAGTFSVVDSSDTTNIDFGIIARFAQGSDLGLSSSTFDGGLNYAQFGILGRRLPFIPSWISLGINMLYRGVDGIQQTEISPSTDEIITTGSFDTREVLLMISSAMKFRDLSIGMNLKYSVLDYTSVGAKKHTTIGGDFGLRYKIADSLVTGTVIKFDYDAANTQFIVATGIAKINRSWYWRTISGELSGGNFTPVKFALGVEAHPPQINWFFIRTGIRLGSNSDSANRKPVFDRLSFGFGIQRWRLAIDAAIRVDVSDEDKYLSLIDSRYKFGFQFNLM